MQTDIIRYNLKDRGRKFRGQPRNFNIPRIVAHINSGAVQEQVKHRDMHGYLEHLPRIKFGMRPGACQIDGAKMVTIEPAMVTTFLKAYDDGTVEHRAEFLDTAPGQVAARMYKSKVGGFSSAIDDGKPEFYGFDYVSEPNFTTNRGWQVALDSIAAGGPADPDVILDEVNQYNHHVQGVLRLLDSVTTAHQRSMDDMLAVVAKLEAENAEFLSMLASVKGKGVALDSLTMEGISPLLVDAGPAERLRKAAAGFRGAAVAGYAPLETGGAKQSAELDAVFDRLVR